MASANALRNIPQVRSAIEDLAGRASISPADIKVVSVEEVVWPDTSLGCPQPGMRYSQVLQDGMRIILRVNNSDHHYHSGGSRAPFLCVQKAGKPRPPQSDMTGPEKPDQ